MVFTNGVVVAGAGGEGTGLDQLTTPRGLAVLADGTLFVRCGVSTPVLMVTIRWPPGSA